LPCKFIRPGVAAPASDLRSRIRDENQVYRRRTATGGSVRAKGASRMAIQKRPVPVIPPLPKAVPYPPESIWRTWEDGKPTQYRGNTFRRQGHIVARVFDVTPTP
jgi:hypothetical protein